MGLFTIQAPGISKIDESSPTQIFECGSLNGLAIRHLCLMLSEKTVRASHRFNHVIQKEAIFWVSVFLYGN